jgi:hypothetical protein
MNGEEVLLCRHNIAHFKKLLASTHDEKTRATLETLITEHEAKLKNELDLTPLEPSPSV